VRYARAYRAACAAACSFSAGWLLAGKPALRIRTRVAFALQNAFERITLNLANNVCTYQHNRMSISQMSEYTNIRQYGRINNPREELDRRTAALLPDVKQMQPF
jgi:hypothetical protein